MCWHSMLYFLYSKKGTGWGEQSFINYHIFLTEQKFFAVIKPISITKLLKKYSHCPFFHYLYTISSKSKIYFF